MGNKHSIWPLRPAFHRICALPLANILSRRDGFFEAESAMEVAKATIHCVFRLNYSNRSLQTSCFSAVNCPQALLFAQVFVF
jgi:hypothetical protein